MSLNNTYFETKGKDVTLPIPEEPIYIPPNPPIPPSPTPGSIPVIPIPTFVGDTTIKLYVNTSERNVLTKNLINETSINISTKEPISTKYPHIELEGLYEDFNYMFFNGKYYFIYPTISNAGITIIDAEKVDSLMTYDRQIRDHSAVIARNANVYNKYLPDKAFKTYAYKQTKTLEFPSGFNKSLSWVLVTVGGSSNQNGGV